MFRPLLLNREGREEREETRRLLFRFLSIF